MVGNAVTNWKYDTFPAYIESGYWHGLYDDQMYDKMHANGCPAEFEEYEFKDPESLSQPCREVVDRFNLLTQDINVFDVYGKCYKPDTDHRLMSEEEKYETIDHNGEQRKYKKFATYEDYTPWVKKNPLY